MQLPIGLTCFVHPCCVVNHNGQLERPGLVETDARGEHWTCEGSSSCVNSQINEAKLQVILLYLAIDLQDSMQSHNGM